MSDESEREPIDVLEVFEASYNSPALFVKSVRGTLKYIELGKASRHMLRRALQDAC